MAIIRKSELRATTSAELLKKLAEIEEEIAAEQRGRKTTGRLSNPGRFRELRRLRARIKTLLRQRGVKEVKEG